MTTRKRMSTQRIVAKNTTPKQTTDKNNKKLQRGFLNGLSHPRPGSHWKHREYQKELVVLPPRQNGWVFFYLIEDPQPRKMPLDTFYHFHTLVRQALPDEDYMAPIKVKTEFSEETKE